MVPPPPSVPSEAGRFQSLRTKRPGGRSGAPRYSSSMASKLAQSRFRSEENQAAAAAFLSSPAMGETAGALMLLFLRPQTLPSAAALRPEPSRRFGLR